MAFCRKLYETYKALDPEIVRYRKNWIVVHILTSLVGISYFIAIPSLHQFVTSSSHPQDSNVQPGLGLSEMWYSWILSVSSLGELIGAILMGLLSRWFYVKHLMLVELLVSAVGGILYGIGKAGWMLLIGRLLIGYYQGAHNTIFRAYLGETSNTLIVMLPPEKQRKSHIKNTNFFVAFGVGTISLAVGQSLSVVAVQIPHLDQFRWPGYWIVVQSVVLAVVVLVLFRERWTDTIKGGGKCGINQLPVPAYTIAYIIVAHFINNVYFSSMGTLINPILGDNFGFSISYNAYVFLSTLVLYVSANVAAYILLKCGVDTRAICLIGFFLSISGSIVTSDWQAIPGDPCDQFSENNLLLSVNSSYSCYTTPSQIQGANVSFHVAPEGYMDAVILNYTASDCGIKYQRVSFPVETTKLEFVGTCTLCSDHLRSLANVTLAMNHDLVCHLNTGTYPEELDCYWSEGDSCIAVMTSGVYAIGSGSGNGLGIPAVLRFLFDVGRNDNIEVGCIDSAAQLEEAGETVMVLLLLNVDEDTSKRMQIDCSNFAGEKVSYTCDDEQNLQDYQCIGSENGVELDYCDGNASCICEAFSGPPCKCFWNPNSRVTGEYCTRCAPLCRSVDHTLNFIQFLVGLTLLIPGFSISHVTLTLITSNALGAASQGLIMGVAMTASSVARITGPLWVNAVYIAVGRRTYLVMSILSCLMIVAIALFLLLYRSMRPKGVAFAPLRAEESEGGTQLDSLELVDTVAYHKDGDRVLLLEQTDCDETQIEDGADGVTITAEIDNCDSVSASCRM